MNKICTSQEQSQRLIELGFDRKSSDMFYWCGEDLRIGGYKAQSEEFDVSAWSLSALLELIPERIPGTKLVIKWDGSYYIEGRDCLCDNAIDAAFEMVCWLKENGKL